MSTERAARRASPRALRCRGLAAALWLAGAGLLATPAAGAAPEPLGVAAVAALSAEPEPATEGSPVCVAAIYLVQPGREEEAAEDLRRLAAVTRKEPGNLLFAIHRSLDDPRQFMVYEQYRSQADLDAHRKTPYYLRYAVEGLQKIGSRTGGTFTPF